MDEFNLSTGWQALILTTVAAIVLKVVEWFLNRNREQDQQKAEESSDIRREQREEIASLNEQLSKTRAEVDFWREKHYENLDAIREMRDQLSMLKIANSALTQRVDGTE